MRCISILALAPYHAYDQQRPFCAESTTHEKHGPTELTGEHNLVTQQAPGPTPAKTCADDAWHGAGFSRLKRIRQGYNLMIWQRCLLRRAAIACRRCWQLARFALPSNNAFPFRVALLVESLTCPAQSPRTNVIDSALHLLPPQIQLEEPRAHSAHEERRPSTRPRAFNSERKHDTPPAPQRTRKAKSTHGEHPPEHCKHCESRRCRSDAIGGPIVSSMTRALHDVIRLGD